MCQEIKDLIKESDGHAISALIYLYNFQTRDEKLEGGTKRENGVGFSGTDSAFLTNLSEFYLNKGYLTPNQLKVLKPNLLKYSNQLDRTGWNREPLEVNKFQKNTPGNSEKKKPYEPFKGYKKAVLDGKNIVIKFAFPRGDNRFEETKNQIKKIPMRKFDSEKKAWTCPKSLEAAEILKENGFTIDKELEDWYNSIFVDKKYKDMKVDLKEITLYPFQKEGVAFLEERKGKALIADEMGLGKTIQAIAYLSLHLELRPAFVIVPASLKLNWKREISRCLPDEKIKILSGRSVEGLERCPDCKEYIYILNYDIVMDRLDELKKIESKVLIIDECHYIKNIKANRSKAVRKISKKIETIIALSGTPIVNRPVEFFNTLNLLRPDLFPSFMSFAFKYCEPKHNGFGWDFKGASNQEELHKQLIKTIMIRRTKIEVLKDLPEKVRALVPIEMENQKEYNNIMDIFTNIANGEGKPHEALTCIEKAKQVAVREKLNNCIKWIEDFLESGEKLVVFATHHFVIDKLKEHFGDISVKLDGRDNMTAKQRSVDMFQEDENIRLFIGNIKAAGVGLTLTAASNVVHLELGWSPGEHDQAGDRVHRIGQENSVTEWYLLADGTIEVEIAELIDMKRKNLDTILDGRNTEENKLLLALLEKYKNKEE